MNEQIVGSLSFVALNASNLLVARAVLEAFPERRQPLERLLVAAAAFLLSATAMVTLLGMAGLLNRLWLVALAGLAGLVSAATLPRRHLSPVGRPASPPSGRWTQAAYGLAAGVAALWVGQALFRGVAYRSDDLSYHGLNLGRWLLDQSFTLTPAVQAYYPANSTAVALWFAVPFGSDAYAGLAGLAYGALLALAVACLLRRAGANPGVTALVAAALLWSHQVRDAGFSLTAGDLAGPALVVAAAVFTLPDSGGSRRLIDTLFAGLLAGSAVGVKPSFLVSAGVVALICLLRDGKSGGVKFAVRGAAVFAGAALAAGGFWYLRNFGLTGNPVFPIENLFFAGPYPRESLRDTTLMRLFATHGSWSLAAKAAAIFSDWPRTLGVAAVVGFLASPWLARTGAGPAGESLSESRQAGRVRQPRAEVARRLLALGATWLIAYPFLPFSGGNSGTFAAGAVHPDVARFLILPLACGLALAGLMDWRGWRRFAPALAAAVLLAEEIRSRRPTAESAVIVLAVFALCFALLQWRRGRRAKSPSVDAAKRLPWSWTTPVVLLLAMGALEPWKLRENRQRLAEAHPVEGLVRAVDSWRRPQRSGILAINYCYPLFGGRFQNDVVWLEPSGTPRPAIHEVFLARMQGRGYSFGVFDEATFLANLRPAGIGHLLLVNFGGPDAWPPQHVFLASRDDAQLVWESKYIAFWSLAPQEPGRAGLKNAPQGR